MIDIEFQPKQENATIAVLSGDGESVSGAPDKLADLVAHPLKSDRMDGKPGTIVDIRLTAPVDLGAGTGVGRIVVVGIGARPDLKAFEKAGAAVVKHLALSGDAGVDVFCSASADSRARLALGAVLASYRFDRYRSTLSESKTPSLKAMRVIGPDVKGAARAFERLAAAASGVALARDLVSEPPNVLHPEHYADVIAENLTPLGVTVTILDEKRLGDLGMKCLLGVGQGSIRQSRVCVMEWNPTGSQESPLALIGKGVTFDTGGISIKPAPGMEEMKGDMAGSAAVVGTVKALAQRRAKAHVVGIVGLVENMPGSNAQRPGDIVVSASGQSVEILNTDAEGRLVLADLLWYAQRQHAPSAMIDLATLTGAIVIALGHERAGLFCTDETLADRLTGAGDAEGELLWRMPLAAAYDRLIDSGVADMKNVAGRGASSITAAQFLKRFVENDTPWAHLDIAGTAWKNGKANALAPTWATGFGVRLLDRLVRDHYEA